MDGLFSCLASGSLVLVLAAPVIAAEKNKPLRVDHYGDPLPEGAVIRLGTVRLRQGDEVKALAFSPDGKLLASGGSYGSLHLWDAATGKEIRWPCPEIESKIKSLAFVPDGKSLVLACLQKDSIQFWDVNTGERLNRPIQHEEASAVRFSPDGKTLATIGRSDNTVRLWDTASGRCLHKLPGSVFYGHTLAFSPDSKLLAVRDVNLKDVCLWEVAAGKLRHRLCGHAKDVDALSFAADGRMLASGAEDRTIRLWETASGKEVCRKKVDQHSASVLAFLAGGRTLAYRDDDYRTIRLWHAAAGQQGRVLARHDDSIDCLCLSPDGRVLAAAGEGGTVRLWDVATGKELLPSEAHHDRINSAAWSPDGRVIATAGDDRTIRFWDAATGKPLRRLGANETTKGVAFSPDGRMLASFGDGETIRMWETASPSKRRVLQGNAILGGDPIFGPERKLYVSEYFAATVHLWDLDRQREIRQMKAPGRLETMALSPDGKIVATGNNQYGIHFWDAATGKVIRQLAVSGAEEVRALAFSPDGRTLASASRGVIDSTVRLWEVATGGERLCLKQEEDSIRGLAFLQEGRILAGAGYHTIYLWDLPSGQLRKELRGHRGFINRIVASPDGRKLLSAGDDTTALIWDVSFADPDRSGPRSEMRPNGMSDFWTDLASTDAARAYRAMKRLVSAPASTVHFFRTRLRPVSGVAAERLVPLIADLDSDNFERRQKAEKALEELGELAVPALEQALKQRPSLEARRRIDGILDPLRLNLRCEQLRAIRAVEVLEHLGTLESQEVLQTLARGAAEARLTQEAKDSLKRLSRRTPGH